MTQMPTPPQAELPTLRELNRATLLAVGAAAVILVTAVLPAEYGIDPIGTGRLLGLTQMGAMKAGAAAGGTATTTSTGDATITKLADGATQVKVTIRPYGGKEVKAWMKAGEQISYDWATDGEKLEYEFHGDPKGAKGDEYTSYQKGVESSAKGDFKAGFEGRHGWYWKNLKPVPVTVTATVRGQYEKFEPL